MTKHRHDRVKARLEHEIEEEEVAEMDAEVRAIPKGARLGVPGRGSQEIVAGGRPAPETGEVERR